jgi:hypothetical protein
MIFIAILAEMEEITKIRMTFIQHSFGLRFAAVVINAGIVIGAVKATMQISAATRTLLLPADESFEFNFSFALVANCHIDRHIDVNANSQG